MPRQYTPLDGDELVDPNYLGTGSPDGTKVLYGDQTWGAAGGVADILDLPTAETDDTLVLAPDGVGGVEFRAETGGTGAPTTADYLVGTTQAGLSAEIVVGTTPGGELGGTWASPTVDATHSGSTHHVEDHDHDGSPTQQLTQANTHQSPDTDSGTSSLHHTIGSGATQAAAGNHTHAGGGTLIIKSADQDVTNAQNQDDTELTFAVTSGKHYVVDLFLLTSGNNTTGDFEYRLAVSAGTMDGRGNVYHADSVLNAAYQTVAAVAAATTSNVVVGISAAADLGFPGVAICKFAFRQNTSSGTFTVQFGNNSASSGRTSRMMQGSTLTYRQTD